MPGQTDWSYLDDAITPALREVQRLEALGLDQETAVYVLAERFRERLLRELWGDVPDFPSPC